MKRNCWFKGLARDIAVIRKVRGSGCRGLGEGVKEVPGHLITPCSRTGQTVSFVFQCWVEITYFNSHFCPWDQATISWFKLTKCGVAGFAFFLGIGFAFVNQCGAHSTHSPIPFGWTPIVSWARWGLFFPPLLAYQKLPFSTFESWPLCQKRHLMTNFGSPISIISIVLYLPLLPNCW